MVGQRIGAGIVLVSFLSQHLAWAAPSPEPQKPSIAQEFKLKGQRWSQISNISDLHDEHLFVLHTPEGRKPYHIDPVETATQSYLMITDIETRQGHFIPIAAKRITVSKNNIYVTTPKDPQRQKTGFYIIRVIDLFHYAFRSPIPVYFIPTDINLGHVDRISVELDEDLNETSLLIHTHPSKTGTYKVRYADIADLIKAQLISLAIYQALTHPSLSPLSQLVSETQSGMKAFHEDLNQALKNLGFTPKPHWKEATIEGLSHELTQLDEDARLRKLKKEYAERLLYLMEDFYNSYHRLMETAELSFTFQDPPKYDDLEEILLPENPEHEEQLRADTHKALWIIGGILAGIVFVRLVLPKILKKPFSQMGADYANFHYATTNRSLIKMIATKLFPNALRADASRAAKFINSLDEAAAFDATSNQFQRSFWKTSGEIVAMICSELAVRPFIKSPKDADASDAIFLSEPFDEMHSLWIQKNVLDRFVSLYVFGTIGKTIKLSIIEKELEEVVQHFILNTQLEQYIDQDFTFNDKQRRQLAELIGQDKKVLEKEISVRIAELKIKQQVPGLSALHLEKEITQIRERWISKIELQLTKPLSETAYNRISKILDAKLKSLAEVSLTAHQPTPEEMGFIKKVSLSIGNAVEAALIRFFGARRGILISHFMKKNWISWKYDFKPKFIHGLLMQPFTRGSYNLSIFLFQRLSALILFTPLYIFTYEHLKKGVDIQKPHTELLFGFAYGMVSCFIYNYLFLHLYEKPIRGTKYDLEFRKYFDK